MLYNLRLFHQPCDFVWGGLGNPNNLTLSLPEFAFLGRSNVGKSSLLNALVYRKTLARVSHTPGRTQQINFFQLAQALYMVDMPGYGYAKVSQSHIKEWTRSVESYLAHRAPLRRLFLLIDSRRGVGAVDLTVLDLLTPLGVSVQILLTKSDEVPYKEQGLLIEKTKEILEPFPFIHPTIILASSRSSQGLDDVRSSILGSLG